MHITLRETTLDQIVDVLIMARTATANDDLYRFAQSKLAEHPSSAWPSAKLASLRGDERIALVSCSALLRPFCCCRPASFVTPC